MVVTSHFAFCVPEFCVGSECGPSLLSFACTLCLFVQQEQLKLIGDATVFISGVGGGSFIGLFLPRGATTIRIASVEKDFGMDHQIFVSFKVLGFGIWAVLQCSVTRATFSFSRAVIIAHLHQHLLSQRFWKPASESCLLSIVYCRPSLKLLGRGQST
jgi:hypothetical protein